MTAPGLSLASNAAFTSRSLPDAFGLLELNPMSSKSRKYQYGSTIQLKRPKAPIMSSTAVRQPTLNVLALNSKTEVDEFTVAVDGQQCDKPKQCQGNQPDSAGPPGKAPRIAKLTITARHQRRAVGREDLLSIGSDPAEHQLEA